MANIYEQVKKALLDARIDSPDIEARWMIKQVCGANDSDFITGDLPCDMPQELSDILARRLSGEPLSRIFGEAEFWGLPFTLSSDTLEPRGETERIIELALERFDKDAPLRILDLGTGSGCILITLLREFPNASGVGVDIALGAVNTARANAKRNHVADRVTFIQGSWLDSVTGEFDLIVSNPPYIENHVIPTLGDSVKNHDPMAALDGGEDGLDAYRTIFFQLSEGDFGDFLGLLEIGYTQGADVSRLSEESGFQARDVHLDYAGKPRVVEISCGDK